MLFRRSKTIRTIIKIREVPFPENLYCVHLNTLERLNVRDMYDYEHEWLNALKECIYGDVI